MHYCLYKLKFSTSLHIGSDSGSSSLSSAEMTVHSDTLFSALCIEALASNELDRFLTMAKSDKFLLSDLLPYKDDEFYLPKLIAKIELGISDDNSKDRKEYKKLKYIPAAHFKDYIAFLKGTGGFDVKRENFSFSPGISQVRTSVGISGNEEPEPYHLGTFTFHDNYGLYVIIGYESDDDFNLLERLLNALSFSGIGGKRTVGLGKFSIDDAIYLDAPFNESLEAISEMLENKNSTYSMTINTSLPKVEELHNTVKNGFFTLLRRGGFVQSGTYSPTPLKKKEIYSFSAGSCFMDKYKGDIYDVSNEGGHPVYRFLKPLFMGVDL